MKNEIINYQDYEINLNELINFLFDGKKFILVFTSFFSIIAVIYTVSLPEIIPTYKSDITFLKPNQKTIIELNKMLVSKESEQTVFYKFLTKALSEKYQKQILKNNKYLNPKNENLIKAYINNIRTLDEENHEKSKLAPFEIPWSISSSGTNPRVTSSFLNDLVFHTNRDLLKELLDSSKLEISNRLNAIAIEKSVILKTQQTNNNFNKELLKLNIEEAKISSIEFNAGELILIEVDKPAIIASEPIKEEGRKRSVILAFQILASFMTSIFLVFIKSIYISQQNTTG